MSDCYRVFFIRLSPFIVAFHSKNDLLSNCFILEVLYRLFENSRKLCVLVKNMIFLSKIFFSLKMFCFYSECGTENQLQIITLVKAIQLFKTIAIGVKFV